MPGGENAPSERRVIDGEASAGEWGLARTGEWVGQSVYVQWLKDDCTDERVVDSSCVVDVRRRPALHRNRPSF
jgi:hypothetical protein